VLEVVGQREQEGACVGARVAISGACRPRNRRVPAEHDFSCGLRNKEGRATIVASGMKLFGGVAGETDDAGAALSRVAL
jgi:hypothetical protein